MSQLVVIRDPSATAYFTDVWPMPDGDPPPFAEIPKGTLVEKLGPVGGFSESSTRAAVHLPGDTRMAWIRVADLAPAGPAQSIWPWILALLGGAVFVGG